MKGLPSAFVLLGCLVTAISIAQAGPPPKDVAEGLKRLEPFLGQYRVEGRWEGVPYVGKTVVRPAIEGWYVQWQFLVKFQGMQRENRWMITYDPAMAKYRIWRFETGPTLPNAEGAMRFEGDRLITEWPWKNPAGEEGTFRNVLWLDEERRLRFRSEFQAVGREPFVISEEICPRIRR